MFKKVWNDPVWSKVIAVGIVGLLSMVFAFMQTLIRGITFRESLNELLSLRIRLIYVLIVVFLVVITRGLLSKKKYYQAKQLRLKRFNSLDIQEYKITLSWVVHFDEDNIPYISRLRGYCCDHNPINLMINWRCPSKYCMNHTRGFNYDEIKEHVESRVKNKWFEITGGV